MVNKYYLWMAVFFYACTHNHNKPLPILGNQEDLDGTIVEHRIRDFSFVNQLGEMITNQSLENHIYVVDFFFTSCPSICPRVKKQMLRIYEYTADYDDFKLMSHTIDPKRDSISVLKRYADNLDIDHNRWYFLHGNKDEILTIANEDYFIAALEDANAPGGFDHSGKLILVDKNRRIRGFCDGTEADSVTKFFKTIDRLRSEYNE